MYLGAAEGLERDVEAVTAGIATIRMFRAIGP